MSTSVVRPEGRRRGPAIDDAPIPAKWLGQAGGRLRALIDAIEDYYAVRVTERALQRLDDHLLHDIGIQRSEIRSKAEQQVARYRCRSPL